MNNKNQTNLSTALKVLCIGAGYVGGPTLSVMALHNP